MRQIPMEKLDERLEYLALLSKNHPNVPSVCTEIINLQAILNLPKATEHFMTDIHGEYGAFSHVLRNASGVLKQKIEDKFGNALTTKEQRTLATLIYYPERKLSALKDLGLVTDDWYRITLYRLILVCRMVSSKYTRSKVRKALPQDFAYIIEELLHEEEHGNNKKEYYNEIIHTIISIDRADEFIIAISHLIQRLAVDHLHLIGDIYDRGPGAHKIMDALKKHHSVDIQWGNHDVLWMGAAAGSDACIANVLRIAFRYANLETIEDGYGINLLPLARFAMQYYGDDPCTSFKPKYGQESTYKDKDQVILAQMHKAISMIQFKLEGQIIDRHPGYEMTSRKILDRLDYENHTLTIDGVVYPLNDHHFPTVDAQNPFALHEDEQELVDRLRSSFMNSEKLQQHVRLLYAKGSMYLIYNENLLFHACIPVDETGEYQKVKVFDQVYSGRTLLDVFDRMTREAYFSRGDDTENSDSADILWYLWCGRYSPLFGKDVMTTFERYFIDDKQTHHEEKNPYFKFRNEEEFCKKILRDFSLDEKTSHIINGHVPVETKKGESPIKANGKMLVIDGGFSKAYQPKTGIAGYTLIYNSLGLRLVAHEPFESPEKAVVEESDILSTTIVLEKTSNRKRVSDTDVGCALKKQVADLEMLLMAYRKGLIKQKY